MYHTVFINVLLAIISALIAIAFYAALLPRRGPHIASHSVCLSVCMSVCLSVCAVSGCTLFTVAPSYDRTSKIEKLLFSLIGQRHVCTFRHAHRAAYRTAISAAQILVYTLRSRKFCSIQHNIDTPSCVVNIPAISISSSLLYSRFHIVCPSLSHRLSATYSGVGIRLKWGDKYWEDWRGGVSGGAVPCPVGGLGACPQKIKSILR